MIKNLKFLIAPSWPLVERWGCIQAGVVLFQNQLLTGVLLLFEWGEVLFKSGVAFARIQYTNLMILSTRFQF